MDTTLILQLAQLLIPILVPLEIAAVKKLAPMLPSWLLPILAPILGGFQAGITGISSVGAGAVLGLAGVGVREAVDQGKRLVTPST